MLNLLSRNISVPFSFLFLLTQFPISYLHIIKLVLVNSGLKRKLQLKKKLWISKYLSQSIFGRQLHCMKSYHIAFLTTWKYSVRGESHGRPNVLLPSARLQRESLVNPFAMEEFVQSKVRESRQLKCLCPPGVLIVQKRRKETDKQQHTILTHGK